MHIILISMLIVLGVALGISLLASMIVHRKTWEM